MPEFTERQRIIRRWGSLKNERSSWWSQWQELSTYLLPRSGRYFVEDRNRGGRRHNNIYDNTGTKAARTLAAGLMGGLTSPARPWFRLATADDKLMQSANVKEWLNVCTSSMLDIFQRSNTYRALHSMYEELAVFGTAAAIVTPDFDNIIHLHTLTMGEYAISTDYNGNANTLYREFQKTVGEVVAEYGYENCSMSTQNMYDRDNLDQWVTLIQAIEPRRDRDTRMRDAKNMPFKSITLELNGTENDILRESGFEIFPVLAPRWAVSGGDIYGNCPGMEALGDVKQLMHEQLRKSEAIDYQTNPPLQAPTAVKGLDVERLPGGVTYYDGAAANPIKSMFEVNLNLAYLLQDIQDVRQRINSAFYADIFLMLGDPNNTRMTATEVAARNEEKMLMLGPVLERLQNELLDPLIDQTFTRMLQAGVVPPPPPELHEQQLNIELVSVLAQAQRAIQTNSIDRFVGNLGMVAQFKPEVLDKLNPDKWADKYSDILGVDPELIVPDEQVAQIREQRAKAQAAAAQQQANNVASQTALNLSKVDTGGKNAATDIMQNLTGYGSSPTLGS